MNEAKARARLVQLKYLRVEIEAEITMLQDLLGKKGRRLRRTALEHGTESGYHWHRNHGIPFPEDEGAEECGCRMAHRAYEKKQAMLRRARKRLAERARQ